MLHGSGGTEQDMLPLALNCPQNRWPPIAVGFSNGAIMAAALIMLYPHLLSGAVLFRPLSPFAADPRTSIPGTPVLITDGSDDHRRSPVDRPAMALCWRDA
jgi:phospholipase/carboxylesterase